MDAAAKPVFALVDVNNMYCSVERLFQPQLRGRPLVVLSGNDGNAVARSHEAKALGVPMGEPWFKLRALAKKHGIVARSSNFPLYADLSNRLVAILRDFSPNLQIYSVDECFLAVDSVANLWPSHEEMGHAIRRRVDQWIGLPVCVGTGAPSLTMAKLANHIAKKRPEFNGVCDLSTMPASRQQAIFDSIDVGEVWGVGRKTADQLRLMNIHTVGALRAATPAAIRGRFGVVVERTCRELQGISCIELEEVPPARQQIISSRSFGATVGTLRELEESVSMHVARASEKLRGQGSVCGGIQVFVMTDRFRESAPQYSNAFTVPLPVPTADLRSLVRAALWALRRIYLTGYQYKKTGVMLSDIGAAGVVQGNLFETGVPRRKSAEVMATLDAVNRRFGRDTLKVASAAGAGRWHARSEIKSPHFTTDWNELPIAR